MLARLRWGQGQLHSQRHRSGKQNDLCGELKCFYMIDGVEWLCGDRAEGEQGGSNRTLRPRPKCEELGPSQPLTSVPGGLLSGAGPGSPRTMADGG